MLADIIAWLIILLPAVVAFAVPKLRKNNGNWMIALKTVPLGVAALFAADKIITDLHRWRCEQMLANIEFNYAVKAALAFGFALLVIIISGWVINKKSGAEHKFNPFPSILLFFPALIAVAILLSLISVLTMFNAKNYQGEWRSVYLPRENGDGFVFEQQSIHPFLAEYNYRLRFVRNRKSTRQQLFVNCGGRTHFNLYRLKDGRLLFRDKDWDYIVDTAKQQVFRLEIVNGKSYIAAVPNEDINSWSSPYEKDGKFVMDMGNHSVTAAEVTGILDGMVYYGCITDRFYPASEKVEKKITKTREQWTSPLN